MKFPKWMIERAKEVVRAGGVWFVQRTTNRRPLLCNHGQCSKSALRMIHWTRATQPPNCRRQNYSPHHLAMRPPAVPQFSHIFSCRSLIGAKVGRLEKAGQA